MYKIIVSFVKTILSSGRRLPPLMYQSLLNVPSLILYDEQNYLIIILDRTKLDHVYSGNAY